jgi:hypothetical protein
MEKVTGVLDQAAALLASALADASGLNLLTDDESLERLAAAERCGRLIDAARVAATANIAARSGRWLGHDSLAWKRGCRNGQDLIARVTLISEREANRRTRLGELTEPRTDVGTVLPPLFPAVARALSAGTLGVETAEVITAGLRELTSRVPVDDLLSAERALVATATGTVTEDTAGLDCAGVAFPTDLVRQQVQVWKARLDPDGTAPNDPPAGARSNIGFGELRKGLYPLRGGVTPEFRGIINAVWDTYLSARATTPAAFPSQAEQDREQARIDAGETIPGADEDYDNRSGGEKRADILRMILENITRDPRTPTMGGAAPTVMVHVNAKDLADEHGVGWIDGVDSPVSTRTVNQLICAGGYRKTLFGDNGEVLHLGGKERFFSSAQRRAIAARDGACIIPGCPVAAAWCEVHHIIPWQHHGPTDITNGASH